MNKSKANIAVISNLLIALITESDKTIRHQMLSLIILVISGIFVLMHFVPVASASGPVSCTIDKTVIDVAGEGPLGNVTNAGDVITYQVNVTNDGNVDLTNVTVNDPLIDNLDGNNDTVLNVGETWTYTGNYSVTQEDINSNGTVGDGFIESIASINCDQVGPKNDTVNVPIESNPDYSIFKSIIGPDEDGDYVVNSPGDIIPYRIIVNNEGNVDLTGISITDPLVTLTGPSGDITDPEVLNPGELWVYTGDYTVTQEDIASNGNDGDGFIENTATVSCNELNDENSTVNLRIIHIPLIIVNSESNDSKALPVANFNTNTTSGNAPLAVQFTDISENAASRSWDFNNDGLADSNQANPVYTYTTQGTYTVNLTASNANGTASKITPITVLKATISSSSGGSGGSSHGSSGAVIVSSSTVSSTHKTNATGNATVRQTQNNIHAEQNNKDTGNIEQTPEKKSTTVTPAKESKKTPCFEIICGIIGLLAVFLFRRKQK